MCGKDISVQVGRRNSANDGGAGAGMGEYQVHAGRFRRRQGLTEGNNSYLLPGGSNQSHRIGRNLVIDNRLLAGGFATVSLNADSPFSPTQYDRGALHRR